MSVVLSQLRWPSLAQDLAVMSAPGSPITEFDQLFSAYGITSKDLKEILTIPEFQALFKQALDTCKTQGNKAGVLYRAMALSQSLSEKLFRDAQNDKMDAKDAVKLLEILLKVGGLLDNKGDNTQVNTQVNIALPLPYGLNNPKIKHIPTPQAQPVTIDVV